MRGAQNVVNELDLVSPAYVVEIKSYSKILQRT